MPAVSTEIWYFLYLWWCGLPGMIYVDLDDNWIYGLQAELDLYGYENPPYFYPPSPTGAHITLLPSAIAEDRGRL